MAKFDLQKEVFPDINYKQDPKTFNQNVTDCVKKLYINWLYGNIGDTRAFNAMQMLTNEIISHQNYNKPQAVEERKTLKQLGDPNKLKSKKRF